MTDLTIFKQNSPVPAGGEGLSDLARSLAASSGSTNRRIIAKKNTFRKIVNGQEVSKHEGIINVIIVNALPAISRQFYDKPYDPEAEATLPDCWSNLGDVPDPKAANPQASSCATCPQNVDGSSRSGKGRACAFQRRIAVILEGDMTGEIYQMNLPATSLFGKGEGLDHPFESYFRFLLGNNKSIDRMVTQIRIDEEVDYVKYIFSPVRHASEEEVAIAAAAAARPEAKNVVRLTVAQTDGVKKLPPAAKPAEDDEEFAPAATPAAVAEPTKRPSNKPAAPQAKGSLADVVDAWSDA